MKSTNDSARASQKKLEMTREHVRKERRSFLDMLAKTGVSASLLKASSLVGGVMSARYATAQGAGAKRVVYCYIHSGGPRGGWLPSSATNMTATTSAFGAGGNGITGYGVANICKFRGVDTETAGHGGARQALGNPSYGTTVDAEIAPILGATTPYSSIILGSNATAGGAGSNIVITSAGVPNDDPASALNAFFGAAPPSAAGDNTFEKSFEAQFDAINAIKAKLSGDELDRLDVHFDALKKIEDRIIALNSGEGPDIGACKPTIPNNYDDSTNVAMVAHGKIQADIIIAALKCGLTNVGVLQIGNHNGNGWVTDVVGGGGGTIDAHGASHAAPSVATFELMQSQKMQIPAYFISRLMTEIGPDGQRLIETTAFCEVTCFGDGPSHGSTEAPFILATQMPGFSTGFSAKHVGATARDFHAEVAQGLGVSPSMLTLGGATGGSVDIL
jgi:hypothetical protein